MCAGLEPEAFVADKHGSAWSSHDAGYPTLAWDCVLSQDPRYVVIENGASSSGTW
jgi:hypothetical protein